MTVYRGGIGQFSWALHRFTGAGVLVFLLLHILDTFLVVLGPEHYNRIIQFYRMPLFRVMEVGLVACVLFHALNGMRIIVLDFHEEFMPLHKRMFAIQMALFVVIMIPVTIAMLMPVFGGGR